MMDDYKSKPERRWSERHDPCEVLDVDRSGYGRHGLILQNQRVASGV